MLHPATSTLHHASLLQRLCKVGIDYRPFCDTHGTLQVQTFWNIHLYGLVNISFALFQGIDLIMVQLPVLTASVTASFQSSGWARALTAGALVLTKP